MTKKNLLGILGTIAVAGLVCYYLYTTNAAYDGGLLDGMMTFFITLPIVGGSTLWKILKGNMEPPTKQKWWQLLLTILILLIALGLVGYQLVVSRFYSLQNIIFCVFLVFLVPFVILERKRGNTPDEHPVRTWAGIFTASYLLIFATVFVYVQVVQPVTVEQATAIVAQEYGEGNCVFDAHLNFHQDYNPLGVYWFAQRYDSLRGWVEVDLVTGTVKLLG